MNSGNYFSQYFAQPSLDLREPPLVMIHASSRQNLSQNLCLASDVTVELNRLAESVEQSAPKCEEAVYHKSASSKVSPIAFCTLQRAYPSAAARAARAEGTPFIVSIETRSDSQEPARGGQTIQYATPTGQLLAAYIQQGIASCPYARHLPTVEPATENGNIASVAATQGIHAVRLICGYTTNYFDYRLLNSFSHSLIKVISRAIFKFLTNNPIKAVGL